MPEALVVARAKAQQNYCHKIKSPRKSRSLRESPLFKEIEEKLFRKLSIRHFETAQDTCVLGRSDSAARILNEHLSLVRVPNAEIKLFGTGKKLKCK